LPHSCSPTARTPDVAVALLGVQAFTTGVAFVLAARSRGPEDPSGENGLGRLFWDHRGGSPGFLFGVQFADGRRASNARFGENDGGLVFHPGGGSGGSHSVDLEWWLSPLPPEGPLSCGPGNRPSSRPPSRRHRPTCPPAAGSPAGLSR
jgi:hypothetical protein